MKRFAQQHPFISGVLVFVIIFLAGSLVGIVVGMVVMASNPCEPTGPNDPCDGGAMAAGMIWSLFSSASFAIGVLLGALTFIGLRLRRNRISN